MPPYYQNLWGTSKQEKIAECIVPQSVHYKEGLSEKYWGRQEFIPSGQQTPSFSKLELDLKSDIVTTGMVLTHLFQLK